MSMGTTFTLPTSTNSTYLTVSGAGGGGGAGGMIGGTNSPLSYGTTTITTSTINIKSHDNGDAIIETHRHKINLDDFYAQTLEFMCMIIPDKTMHREYPTLQDAWDNYLKVRKEHGIKIDSELRDAYNQYQSLKAILTAKEP